MSGNIDGCNDIRHWRGQISCNQLVADLLQAMPGRQLVGSNGTRGEAGRQSQQGVVAMGFLQFQAKKKCF